MIPTKHTKILILTDPHCEHKRMEKIIKHEAPDLTICLGDWWDSFYLDTKHDVNQTTEYFLDFIGRKDTLNLTANHDHYKLPFNSKVLCSGFTPQKREYIQRILRKAKYDWTQDHKYHCVLDNGFLLSHAGIHTRHLPPFFKLNLENVDKWLIEETQKCTNVVKIGATHWFWEYGYARGGNQPVGGIVTMDATKEFQPIAGINQLFGHSSSRTGKIYTPLGEPYAEGDARLKANNLCLDCGSNEYLTITNGVIKINEYRDI